MFSILKIILVSFICECSLQAFAPCNFRIEDFKYGKKEQVEFIIPPQSRLKLKGNEVDPKYRYHFIRIGGLNESYLKSTESINEASYYYDKRPDGKTRKDPFVGKPLDDCDFCDINEIGGGFVLRVDYEKVFKKDKADDIVRAFNEMPVALLKHFSKKENAKDSTKWATNISQNIVEKIFELIPVPQKASLARYALIITDSKSFVLINPRIWLLVDNVNKSYINLEKEKYAWQYNLSGQTLIQLNRGDDGRIVQAPFLIINNRLSETTTSDSTETLQASTADVQLSNSLYPLKYVALYQEGFKRNNSQAEDGSCANADFDYRKCNSELLLFESADQEFFDCIKLFDTSARCTNNSRIISSTFGLRTLITPAININLNSESRIAKLNSTLRYLVQTYELPRIRELKIYRKYRGSYRRIVGVNGNLLLLPNDRIQHDL